MNVDRQLSVYNCILQGKGNEISLNKCHMNEIPHVNCWADFLKSCNINFSMCLKLSSIHGIEVVLSTRRNFLFSGITGILIDCVFEFNTHSNQKYQERHCLPMSRFTRING